MLRVVLCTGVFLTSGSNSIHAPAEETRPSVAQTAAGRRPVGAVLIDDARRLCIVNRESGSVSLVDAETAEVVHEERVGERLSSVAAVDHQTLLITDEAAHTLLVVDLDEDRLAVRNRVPVVRSPVNVAIGGNGHVAAVAGLWSRRVTLLPVAASLADAEISDLKSPIRETSTVRLPFSPRLQQFLDNGRRLVVADAFGGRIAVVNVHTHEVESIRELPAQNIRGMAVSADGTRLLLTHQVLSPLARADYDDIHWGNLLRNVMREVDLDAVLDPAADLVAASRTIALGDLGNGAADPAGITLLPELGGWIACLSGVGEVSIGTRYGGGRVAVGARPTEVVWDAKRRLAYVLCTLDDLVAVVDPVAQSVVKRISLGPQPALLPADRGERLFYDGRRSHDAWISCHSCHPDGHTTGGLADTRSDNSYGTPKRILSLLGTRDNNPWGWNGQFRELHEQVGSSFTSTLNGSPLSAPEINDVVAFLHTLTPPPPVEEGEWTPAELERIQTGRELFAGLGCAECHVPPQTYTIDQTFDVGLSDAAGLTKFNPPSLRGVSHRDRLFHDGRAESLEAVITDVGHQIDKSLSEDELAALLAYLRSL